MGKIIAFSGKAGSGKTTAAKFIEARVSGARRFSFAEVLKAKALEDFGEHFTADDLVNNKTKEIVISGRKTTLRQLLIDIGMLYRQIDRDFWLNKAVGRALRWSRDGGLALIDDMRFPNEYEALRGLGAVLVRIERPGIPAIDDESEWALDEYAFDLRVANDGDLDLFYSRIADLAQVGTSDLR